MGGYLLRARVFLTYLATVTKQRLLFAESAISIGSECHNNNNNTVLSVFAYLRANLTAKIQLRGEERNTQTKTKQGNLYDMNKDNNSVKFLFIYVR
jgi:hypothetical protein